MNDNLRNSLTELVQHPSFRAVVDSADCPVYLVGGAVRDMFLGRRAHDLDIIVEGDLDGIASLAAQRLGRRAVLMGRPPFQIYRIPDPDLILDICPPAGQSITEDLTRRDLTVNALAVRISTDPLSFEILDPTNGLADLSEGTARFISENNVIADPLRLLRLFRLAASHGFSIEPESVSLAARHAHRINQSAGERIHEELLQLLCVPRSSPFVRIMLETGLLEKILPELSPLRGLGQNGFHHLDVLDHTLLAFERLEDILCAPESRLPRFVNEINEYLATPRRRALLKLTVLLHDLGKAGTRAEDEQGRIHFHGHEKESAIQAIMIAGRLRMSSEERDMACDIIRNHLYIFHLLEAHRSGQLTPKGVFRFGRAAGEHLWGLILHTLADAEATQGPASADRGGAGVLIDFINNVLDQLAVQEAALRKAPGLIDGNVLQRELGLSPSPLIGKLLGAIEAAQATGEIQDRDQALALARKMMGTWTAGKDN